MLLNPLEPEKPFKPAWLSLGFRPFFLLASLYAIVSIGLWAVQYFHPTSYLARTPLVGLQWHAHEMVYGYSLAVIAGFILTAVRNWTKRQTIRGVGLFFMCLCWVLARVALLLPVTWGLWLAMFADMLFGLLLIGSICIPIVAVKQWRQLAVVSKIAFMILCNLLFYLSALSLISADGMRWGLYGGLYLVLSLIMMMGRRVIPSFIQGGVDETITIGNRRWLDVSSLVLFLGFAITEIFFPQTIWASSFAGLLFLIHAARLQLWYTHGIWRKPLLWVLYSGYLFITVGFLLKALSYVWPALHFPALHAFAVGGIGMTTIGMISRVSLGHTGRNVREPPPCLNWIFCLLLITTLVRVAGPVLLPSGFFDAVIVFSMMSWGLAFALLLYHYTPILIKPDVTMHRP